MAREVFKTERFSIAIEAEETLGVIEVVDLYSGVKLANGPYRYSIALDNGESVTFLEGLSTPKVERKDTRDDIIVTISGRAGTGTPGTPSIYIEHQFVLPKGAEYFEERISITNNSSKDYKIRGYRFGFRKLLEYDEKSKSSTSDLSGYRMIAIPFRIQPDGKRQEYYEEDLYLQRYQCSELENPLVLNYDLVDRDRGRSEGWAWTDGENGLLIIKYNPDLIEYSMLNTEQQGDQRYLNFGGAAPALFNEPREVRKFSAGRRVDFGITRYTFYEGLWRRAYNMFKEFMTTRGHGLPDNYNPPFNWNELFDIGWHHNDREKLKQYYTKEALFKEAEKAADIGCTLLYLDPGWETCEGATIWDEERLGKAEDFVREIKEQFGLDVGFRTVGRTYCNAYPGLYRRNADGSVGFYRAYSGIWQSKPFYEPCLSNPAYIEEKAKRIIKIAETGMKFIMFDEFDWRGACFDPNHDHGVPTTPGDHARHVIELVQRIKAKFPEITVEAHDPVWPWGPKYLPVYFLHGLRNSFDEGWGFEFMWHPLDDLISGKALTLFYYNAAYDLPLYNHITMEHDNDNCLAFWWYASTVRHLGIGGKKGLDSETENETRYQAYKKAVSEYLSLRELYTQGTFYGIDETIHIHVLPEQGQAVLNAFNITNEHVSREVEVNLNELGLFGKARIEGAEYRSTGVRTTIKLELPPMSPKLVKFTVDS